MSPKRTATLFPACPYASGELYAFYFDLRETRTVGNDDHRIAAVRLFDCRLSRSCALDRHARCDFEKGTRPRRIPVRFTKPIDTVFELNRRAWSGIRMHHSRAQVRADKDGNPRFHTSAAVRVCRSRGRFVDRRQCHSHPVGRLGAGYLVAFDRRFVAVFDEGREFVRAGEGLFGAGFDLVSPAGLMLSHALSFSAPNFKLVLPVFLTMIS